MQSLTLLTLCALAIAIFISGTTCASDDRPLKSKPESPRVAIIGGGIGGTTTAYYLRRELGFHISIDM